MKVAVVGSGGWGTALALVLLENGHEVTLWSFSEKEAEILRTQRENPLLKGVALPAALKICTEIACVAEKELVVFATPSFAVRETAQKAAPYLGDGTLVVSVSKGIEKRDVFAVEPDHRRRNKGTLPYCRAVWSFPRRGGRAACADGLCGRIAGSRSGRNGAGCFHE